MSAGTEIFGAVTLLASFTLLALRRSGWMVPIYAAQAAAVALAAAWQGVPEGSIASACAGLAIGAIKALIIPAALRRTTGRRTDNNAAAIIPTFPTVVLAATLTALAIAAAMPRVPLALALSVTLLGLLMMAARRAGLARLIGLLSLENGVAFGATASAGNTPAAVLPAATLLLVAFGVVLFRMTHAEPGDGAARRATRFLEWSFWTR